MIERLCVCDIDGVIADTQERYGVAEFAKEAYIRAHSNPLSELDPRLVASFLWDVFFLPELARLDTPIKGASDALAELERRGWGITLLTSRRVGMQDTTLHWLNVYISSYQIVWGVTFKPDSEQFKKTATWKLECVQRLVALHGVKHLLFVDDEVKNAEAVLNWHLGSACPGDIQVCSSLALAVSGD